MSFAKFNPHGFTAGAIGLAVPLTGALVGGTIAGAQAAGDQIVEARAMSARERYIEAEMRLLRTIGDADDAVSEQRRAAAGLRLMLANRLALAHKGLHC